MGLQDYLDKDKLAEVSEKAAKLYIEELLFPALDKVVADSANPWDDQVLEVAKQLIRAALDKIHEPEELPPAA